MVASNNKTVIGLIPTFRNLRNVVQGPNAALFYGAWGVLPFISIPIYLSATGKLVSQLVHANLTYGVGILTFLGAVRWGLAIPNSKDKTLRPNYTNMGLAVFPCCLGWLSLLVPQLTGNVIVLGGFIMSVIQDVYSVAYPPWYKSFRIIFSASAIFSFATILLLFQSTMTH